MASAPKQKPLIVIPGIKSNTYIEMPIRGAGEQLTFQMFIGKRTGSSAKALKPVSFDPDNEWMDRSWFGLVVRELDRLKVWTYDVIERDGQHVFVWSKSKPVPQKEKEA